MKDEILNLKVTVDERSAISWLVVSVRKELYHFLHARNLSHWPVGVDIDHPTLRLLRVMQGLQLTSVEATSVSKTIQSHYIDVDSVEFRQCCYDFMPPTFIGTG